MDVRESIIGRGGLAAARELARDGIGRAQLTSALRARRIFRVRQGWFALPGLDPELTAAARVGGVATCVTALAQLGIWVPPDDRLHVGVVRNACQLRSPDDARSRLGGSGVRVHWDAPRGSSRLRAQPIDAVVDLAQCIASDYTLASIDSMLRRRPDLRPRFTAEIGRLPIALRAEAAALDGARESGTETLFFIRMRRRVAAIRCQVAIAGVGRVDFLIGDRLVVEVDGREYHTDPAAFERDRRRDTALTALGYRVLRFSYRQVMFDWAAVEAAVLAVVQSGGHR